MKYIVSGNQDDFTNTEGHVPLAGHSLSWNSEKDTIGPNNKLIAKIWVPSDPRKTENCVKEMP